MSSTYTIVLTTVFSHWPFYYPFPCDLIRQQLNWLCLMVSFRVGDELMKSSYTHRKTTSHNSTFLWSSALGFCFIWEMRSKKGYLLSILSIVLLSIYEIKNFFYCFYSSSSTAKTNATIIIIIHQFHNTHIFICIYVFISLFNSAESLGTYGSMHLRQRIRYLKSNQSSRIRLKCWGGEERKEKQRWSPLENWPLLTVLSFK